MSKYIDKAKDLFEWNKQNLISNSHLKKEEIARFFATEFRQSYPLDDDLILWLTKPLSKANVE